MAPPHSFVGGHLVQYDYADKVWRYLDYGMEIEPKYVAVVLERLSALGLEPRRCDG